MYIASFKEHVELGPGLSFLPGLRYIVNGAIRDVIRKHAEHQLQLFDSFNPFERRWRDPKPKRILVQRHDAYGDQLMATGFVRVLKSLYPSAKIDVACSPRCSSIWDGLADNGVPYPVPFECVYSNGAYMYDWMIFFDELFESVTSAEQGNAYDIMLNFAGVNPDEIPRDLKRPSVEIRPGDLELYRQMRKGGLLKPRRFLVYQLGASNYVRTYPPELAAEFLALWMREKPDWPVLVVGTDERAVYRPKPEQSRAEREILFKTIVKLTPPAYEGHLLDLVDQTPDFRQVYPLIGSAGLVVCPDSSIGHLAGAFPSVPTISLWGPFSPADRVSTYANHHPLVGLGCTKAPCRKHFFWTPAPLCEEGQENRQEPLTWHRRNAPYCNALASIRPEKILELALELTKPEVMLLNERSELVQR